VTAMKVLTDDFDSEAEATRVFGRQGFLILRATSNAMKTMKESLQLWVLEEIESENLELRSRISGLEQRVANLEKRL